MRYIPVNCIRDGMICGKKIYGKNGQLLLNQGATIYSSYIETINRLGYSGIYIEDDLSKDVEIVEVISSEIRLKTVTMMKSLFKTLENGQNLTDKNMSSINSLIGDIVENILSNKNLMINMVDLKVFDDYTFYHSVNVAVLSIVIGVAYNLNKNQLYLLGLGAILHDIGKVFISEEILNKPGKLTEEEYEHMKNHSIKGYEYLKERLNIPIVSYIGVLQHHEKYDGTGYPHSTEGTSISLFGKIIAIADVYDALVSDRPYRKSLLPSEAMEYIMGGSGTMFDPQLVNVFIQRVAPYPVGTSVLLSNEYVGIVVENYSDCCLRPKIKVIGHKNKKVTPYYLSLKEDRSTMDVTIVGISDISEYF